jgi:preprotein translocase subunit YajC
MLLNTIDVAIATMMAILVGIGQVHHVLVQRAQRKRIRELEDLISWYVTADLP